MDRCSKNKKRQKTKNKVPIEQRSINEVWDKTSKDERIEIKNPAFEFVNKKYITGISHQ